MPEQESKFEGPLESPALTPEEDRRFDALTEGGGKPPDEAWRIILKERGEGVFERDEVEAYPVSPPRIIPKSRRSSTRRKVYFGAQRTNAENDGAVRTEKELEAKSTETPATPDNIAQDIHISAHRLAEDWDESKKQERLKEAGNIPEGTVFPEP